MAASDLRGFEQYGRGLVMTPAARPVEVGDFIRVPAWRVEGQVLSVGPSDLGSPESITVLLQERPEGPGIRYRLEPNEYEVL